MTDQNNEARDMWAEALSSLFKGDSRKNCTGFQMMRLMPWRGCVRTDGQRQDRQKLTGICLFRGADIRFTFRVHGYCSLLTVNKLISVLWCWGKPLLLILTRLLIPSFD
jgi:hypothetical protein